MIYIHYCSKCDAIRMLNGHKPVCPACDHRLRELKITFTQYTALSASQRENFLAQIRQPQS